jgi:cytochrome c
VTAEKPAQIAPAPAAAAPPAKTEPAAVVAKPETKAEPAVSEADALQLAKKSNCLACHAIDKKVVGPAWKDVAAKYRGDAGAEARIMDKIAKGGSGVWGVMIMPPSPQVSEADRKTLARFVLSLK